MTPDDVKLTVPHRWEFSDYLNPAFLASINKEHVQTICELGCHDGADTLRLFATFGVPIHAFECHPESIRRARARCASHPQITLVQKAIWDTEGRIPFYPISRAWVNGVPIANSGASSCFRARADYLQTYQQDEIWVESIRLDAYCQSAGISRVDLVCMDLQGAALPALRGWGSWLTGIRYIIAEIEHRPIYHGQSLFPEVHACLAESGFRPTVRVLRDAWFSDYLYVNSRLEP